QVGGLGPRSRVVLRAGGEADGALLEALPHEAAGGLQVTAAERRVPEPEHLEPHRGERNQVGGVDGDLSVVVAPEGGDTGHAEVPDGGDRLAADAHVSVVPGCPTAVDDGPAAHDEVEHHGMTRSRDSRVSRSCPAGVTSTGSPSAT